MEKKSVIESFVEYMTKNRGLSELTGKEYRKDLRDIQTWMVTHAKVERWSTVTKDLIDDYVSDLVSEGLKPATIKRRISCLRSFYQWAWVQGLQKENPAKYVSTPKLSHLVPKTLPTEVIQATISDATIPQQTRAMVAVLAETGVRISELLDMRLTDVDVEHRRIVVRGKGDKERSVYYGVMTAGVVANAKAVGAGRLFPLCDRDARYRIHSALRRHTTSPKASSHIIRHTWATEMLNAGASLSTIQALLGHSSVKTTERYAKVAGVTVATEYNKYMHNYGRRESA